MKSLSPPSLSSFHSKLDLIDTKNMLRINSQTTRFNKLMLLALLVLSHACFANHTQTVFIEGHPARVTVSSQLPGPSNDKLRYDAAHLFDGKAETAWVEGEAGIQTQHHIEITFASPVQLQGLLLTPGYHKSSKLYVANAVPYQVSLSIDKHKYAASHLRYGQISLTEQNTGSGCRHIELPQAMPEHLWLLPEERPVTQLSLTIQASLPGSHYPDMAISEIKLIGRAFAEPTVYDAMIQQLSALPNQPWAQQRLPFYKLRYGSAGWQIQNDTTAPAQSMPLEDFKSNASLLQQHFFETWLNVEKSDEQPVIIGSTVATKGDSEWIEVAPALGLKPEGPTFYWRSFQDSAPGCHHGWPANSVKVE
ncbi:NADase-type glycan-binding domain-containing protein [Motilimonas pumila]|nr:hypothetical protein [Motilimonas pumila]